MTNAAFVSNISQKKKNKNPTWPWVFHEFDSIFLKLKISRIFSRVIICQLALLFVIVLLFLCDSGKAALKLRKDLPIELKFIIVNRFTFIALTLSETLQIFELRN